MYFAAHIPHFTIIGVYVRNNYPQVFNERRGNHHATGQAETGPKIIHNVYFYVAISNPRAIFKNNVVYYFRNIPWKHPTPTKFSIWHFSSFSM